MKHYRFSGDLALLQISAYSEQLFKKKIHKKLRIYVKFSASIFIHFLLFPNKGKSYLFPISFLSILSHPDEVKVRIYLPLSFHQFYPFHFHSCYYLFPSKAKYS